MEITPIRSVDKINVGVGKRGEITKKIQETYISAVRANADQYKDWLSQV